VFGYLSVLPELIVFKGWLWFKADEKDVEMDVAKSLEEPEARKVGLRAIRCKLTPKR
jgi:hypothetical protein